VGGERERRPFEREREIVTQTSNPTGEQGGLREEKRRTQPVAGQQTTLTKHESDSRRRERERERARIRHREREVGVTRSKRTESNKESAVKPTSTDLKSSRSHSSNKGHSSGSFSKEKKSIGYAMMMPREREKKKKRNTRETHSAGVLFSSPLRSSSLTNACVAVWMCVCVVWVGCRSGAIQGFEMHPQHP
jgi:cobalamin biosynthesis Mg chelatase CobN